MRLNLKLEHLGIRGNVLNWINSFLTGRKFYVRIGQSKSALTNVDSGVPQGSVLGPVLFILYTADLPPVLSSQTSLYADDTKIFGNPLENCHIQGDLEKILEWSSKWLITLNANKCCVVHAGRNNPQVEYKLNNNNIVSSELQIDLGVTMKNNLKWDSHILNIVNKANKLIYLVKKAFHNITTDLFLKLYKTFIRPILEFGFQIWNPYFQKDIDLLEKVQRRATKILPSGFYHIPYEQRLLRLKLPTLQYRRLRGDLIETFKIFKDVYNCPNIKNIYSPSPNVNLRGHKWKLVKDRFTTNPRKHFISNRIVEQWNKLPHEVIESSSLNQFKNRLDMYLSNAVQ